MLNSQWDGSIFFPGHDLVTCLSCMGKNYSKTSGGALRCLSGKEAAVYGTVTQHRTHKGTHLGPLLVALRKPFISQRACRS